MPRPCRAPTMPLCKRVLKGTPQNDRVAAWALHDMCELTSAVERRSVSNLPTFGFCRLLYGHSLRLLTRKLLPFGMCWIVLMTMEIADYTEYELTLKLKPVSLRLLCSVSIEAFFFFLDKGSPFCSNYTLTKRKEKINAHSLNTTLLSMWKPATCSAWWWLYIAETCNWFCTQINLCLDCDLSSFLFSLYMFILLLIAWGQQPLKFSNFGIPILKYLNNYCLLSYRRPNRVWNSPSISFA